MTSPGANDELADKLSDPAVRPALQQYLTQSRWIHISSFVDRKCLALVTELLRTAKSDNNSLIISFDPGSEYCRNPSDEVRETVKVSDYLFLTGKEFAQLAGYAEVQEVKKTRMDETKLASSIYESCQCQNLIVVLKSYNSTRFFQSHNGSVVVRRFWHVPLLPPSIVDDTGAGDVFTAGFIAGRLIPVLAFDMKTVTSFSSRLVKAKLKTAGGDEEGGYSAILTQTLRDIRLRGNLNLRDLARTVLSELKGIIVGIAISSIAALLVYLLLSH